MNTSSPPSPPAFVPEYEAAVAAHRAGKLERARHLYTEILAAEPDHADALHMLGVIAIQSGDTRAGIELINQSLAAKPDHPAAYSSLGNALRSLKRPEEALRQFERALALDPNYAPALNNRGCALMDLGRPHEALQSYELALRLKPMNSGNLCNYGDALLAVGRHQEALQSYERALQIKPDLAAAACARGKALRELHRLDEALESLNRCLAIDPKMAAAHHERGSVLREMLRLDEAILSYDRAIELDPSSASTFFRRGIAFAECGKNGPAAASFSNALKIAPRFPFALGGKLLAKRMLCDWASWEEDSREVLAEVGKGNPAIIPFSLLCVADAPAAQLQCARDYVRNNLPLSPLPLWSGEPYGHTKIRLAYISADLRLHALAALMIRVFEQHDRSRFEVIAVSLRPAESSSMGERLRSAFDEFIDASQMSDLEVANLIRQREIDIAVDLMGFTGGSRTGILAYRPAPVQVNYLGFPGTMGSPYIDYILADDFLIPSDSRKHFAESVVWLPDCFQPNDERRAISAKVPLRRDLALPQTGFVFCCFNNNYKINPPCFEVWMRLLREIPGSILWILGDEPAVEANLRIEAERRGVAHQRLVFARRIPYPDHLARLQCADLFLDTVPFNAGTTASDALWAGLPILTCAGQTFAARMAGSLLRAMRLPELITSNLEEYEALALELARTPQRLNELRRRVAQNRVTSPLFDGGRICRHLESAYTAMWRRTEFGMPPDSFSVEDSQKGTDE
jgi:predicted O-linked N-acetylglucosamine transferase (SPINDLY family)